MVCPSVCLSVCHDREPCKNRWTDWDAVSVVNSGGPKEPRITGGFRSPNKKGQFWGGTGWPIVTYGDSLPWTGRDAVWDMDSGWSKRASITCRWVHIGATWRIRLTRPRPAEVRLFCQITLTTCIHFRTVLCVPDATFNWKTSLNLVHLHEVANWLVIAITV